MESSIGTRIRVERQRLGWDQAELARRLGDVTQQTVSRWERGLSRPRRNMIGRLAGVLGVNAAELLQAAGFTPTTDRPSQVRAPVRPRLIALPLADLSSEMLEQLVADVAHHLYPDAAVSRFGGQGHTQYGLDVVAQQGQRCLAGFQCKRHQRFGPQQVRDAVAAVSIEADAFFLVLSRSAASPQCRREIANHSGWKLWDAEDLSRVIRTQLPLDTAVRIVDTYFPGWREPLLGVSSPGPWLDAGDFFRPLAGGRIYTHSWQMVGRAEALAGITTFLDGDDRIALVVGRGGIGKSRLLRAVAEAAERGSTVVRLLSVGADLTSEQFELLPSEGQLLVVIDDAHDRSDIATVLTMILRLRPNARVLLALRPYGLGPLTSDLRGLGLHPSDVPTWTLPDLSNQDTEALAREALGPDQPELLIRRLAGLTADCPLVTVVGGVLIRQGQLDPACLEHERTVRTEILRAFRDALIADPLSGDVELRRSVLDAVAALQPFRGEDPSFQAALGNLVSQPFDRTVSHLNRLEDAGVLLRRGGSLRIVPDLLGDIVLAEACYDDRSGASTGYIERACTAIDGQPLQHLFVNATRIDWQVRHDRPEAPRLASTLWSALEHQVQASGITGRREALQLVGKAAHFEPTATLALVRWIVDHPIEGVEDIEQIFTARYLLSYDHVLHEIPPLLKGVAYTFEHLQPAADLLWELAQRDTRPTNQFPEHAFRVLRDLSGIEIGKPLAYNHALIDAAQRWLERPDHPGATCSPFDVLEPMLVTEGTDNSVQGHRILFKPFQLSPSSVTPLRDRIISLALREALAPDVRRAVSAVQLVEAALRYPSGMFGREVHDAERDQWTPVFVDTLKRLGNVAAHEGLDPVVAVAIRRAIHWHADYSSTETRVAALQVRGRLPASLEHQLAFVLFDGWGHLTEEQVEDYQKAEARRQERMQLLANALIEQHADDELTKLLIRRLSRQQAAFGSTAGAPNQFVWTLTATRPSVALKIIDRVAEEPTTVLLQVVAVAIAVVADSRPDVAVGQISMLADTGVQPVRQRIAQALGWNRGARSTLLEGELNILTALGRDKDEYTRTSVVRAAQRLAAHHPAEAVTLISHVPFSDSERVAEEVFQSFGPQGELPWQQLPENRSDEMLRQLQECPRIESYSITRFLAELSEREPSAVVDLLKARVERWETSDTASEYHALPFQWDQQLMVRQHRDFMKILRDVLQWIAAAPNSWRRHHAGGELFTAIANGFDTDVISVLDEATAAASPHQLEAVASVLQAAPSNLVYENVEFVRRALTAAAQLGDEYAQRIGGAMHAATTSGVRSGTPGEPFAQDIHQRDRSARVADQLPQGSLEERFYRSLQESAEQSIRWSLDQDERMADNRDW